MAEGYSKPCQISKMELFSKIVHGLKPLTIFAKYLKDFSIHF